MSGKAGMNTLFSHTFCTCRSTGAATALGTKCKDGTANMAFSMSPPSAPPLLCKRRANQRMGAPSTSNVCWTAVKKGPRSTASTDRSAARAPEPKVPPGEPSRPLPPEAWRRASSAAEPQAAVAASRAPFTKTSAKVASTTLDRPTVTRALLKCATASSSARAGGPGAGTPGEASPAPAAAAWPESCQGPATCSGFAARTSGEKATARDTPSPPPSTNRQSP
mmetsp:Transcript_55645/g.150022  ORF Transcript_55645/g.150022 Transcript_55645/m.150022 type:complete len:222 (+) Transcript_55645:1295-1960(+)